LPGSFPRGTSVSNRHGGGEVFTTQGLVYGKTMGALSGHEKITRAS